MGWRQSEQVTFAVSNLVEALSPSNNPLTSPVAWKAAIDTGGIERVQLHADLIISPGWRECSLTPELLRWRTPPSSSAAQLGQELRPSARCRCTMGPSTGS